MWYAILVLYTNGLVTSTSDLYLCQTPSILYLYLHLCSNTFELAMLLNVLNACDNTSISGSYIYPALIIISDYCTDLV